MTSPAHQHQDWVEEVARKERDERVAKYGPNPVIEAGEAGHQPTSVTIRGKEQEICRLCNPAAWPCDAMVRARQKAAIRGAKMHDDLHSRPVPGSAQYTGS